MALFIETELKSKSECGVIIMGVINLFLSVRERKKSVSEKKHLLAREWKWEKEERGR